MFKLILLTLMTTITKADEPKTHITVDKNRVVIISGVINHKILTKANQLVELSTANKDTIDIIIESPGGAVTAGLIFIDAMRLVKLRGIKLRCIVPSYAASMAFILLTYCNERITLSNTLLLFHKAHIFGLMKIDTDEAKFLKLQLEILIGDIDTHLMNSMNMATQTYYYHNHYETLWTATALKKNTNNFLKITQDIRGLDKLFKITKSKLNKSVKRLLSR